METRIKALAGCIVLVMLVFTERALQSFPYGYKRLRGKQNTITVFYDFHEASKNTSVDEMKSLSYKDAKKKLYRSEQRLLTGFEHLNNSEQTMLVWEFRRGGRPATPYFIGLAPTWIRHHFKNIRFVSADNNRISFQSNFLVNEPNLTGATFHNPMPLSRKLQKKMRARSGDKAWQAYRRLYLRVKRQLYDDYRELHYLAQEQFWPTRAYDQIADLEILAHVLSSDKKNIIVYCGGSHSERIVNFLRMHADCELTERHGCKDIVEISPRSLDRVLP